MLSQISNCYVQITDACHMVKHPVTFFHIPMPPNCMQAVWRIHANGETTSAGSRPHRALFRSI